MAYIGEGDDVSKRLYQHARSEDQNGKDFWDRAIVLTSKDTNLTKAHAHYLESRFIMLALQASRARLTNGTTPPPIVLPEADVSDMEYFIEQAKIVLPVLGVSLFRSPRTTLVGSNSETAESATDSPLFEMALKKSGITATAQEVDGEFTVIEGSSARPKWTGGEGHSYTSLRAKLEQDGTLVPTPDGSAMRFTRNHVFASPSAAAAIVAGRSANGRTEWLIQGARRTYGQWETEGVEEAMKQEVTNE
ncbi:GIY-YIG nuclease family protein [Rhodococcus sp. 14-2470-1a]|uniref:GIY-YIG nuclease family protein n=1 Tax=Rhodococcus sp. 14-2470-1a TaxID=2023150 RepID=UPI00211B4EBC|nr:GIY-YIG nuclease family protein [Rhodococcus sp. 14-2470-1a]